MTHLNLTLTPELYNDHDGAIGGYHRAYKSLQDQHINIQVGINRDLEGHIEYHLLASELLGKCEVFVLNYHLRLRHSI